MADRRRSYDYTPSTYEEAAERADRKTSQYVEMFKDAKMFTPKQGASLVRILPPFFKAKKRHYGLTLMVHRNVGPRDQSYLCLRENDMYPGNDKCPVCEELYRLGAHATKEDKQLLTPKPVVVYYIIDRDNEKDGVQVWRVSPRIDGEISGQTINRRNGSYIDVVHPEDGYDLEFTRQGTGLGTKYNGFKFMREPSSVSDSDRRFNEWMDVASERPLDQILVWYSADEIKAEMFGDEKQDDSKSDRLSRHRSDDDDDRRGSSRSRRQRDDDDDVEQESRSRIRRVEDKEEQVSRSRDDDDGDEQRGRAPSPFRARDDEPEERSRSRSRTTAEEIDDEIPSEGRRRAATNGRGRAEDEDMEDRPSGRRTRLEDDDSSRETTHNRRAAVAADEPEERTRERTRSPDDDGDGYDKHTRMKARLASRLKRTEADAD